MRCSAVPYTLLLVGLLTTPVARAYEAGATEAAAPAATDVWPVDCTRDVQRDGLVLIDAALGEVQVSLRPSNEAVDIAGSFVAPSDGVQVWQSAEPLLPQTEYRLALQPAQGEPLISHFTTGDALQAPLALGGEPAARVLPHTAAAADAELSVESQRDDVVVLRIALPGVTGGLSHRPLALRAALEGDVSSEQALGARIEDNQSAPPNQPVAFQLQAVLDDEPSERCVTISAQQDFGALDAAPLCIKLPARTTSDVASGEASEVATDGDEPSTASGSAKFNLTQVAQADAGGCSLGARHPVRDGSWLLLALLPLLAGRRRLATAKSR